MATSASDSITKLKAEGIFESMDGPDLVPLLQCMGFVLLSMDKSGHIDQLPKLPKNQEENVVKAEITCIKSGMKATLFKENCICKCPPEEAESWNISGCAQGNLSGTKTNLVPTISPMITKAITALLLKCMEMITSANANDSADAIGELKQNLSKITLGSSAPKHCSSPIPDLCKSLKTSRSSLDGIDSLTNVLKRIDKLVKQALELAAGTNTTFTKTPRTSESLKISPLVPVNASPLPSVSSVDNNLTESSETPSISTPKRQVSTTGAKKKGLLPPSRLNLLKYKRERVSSLERITSSPMVKDRIGSISLSTTKLKSVLSADTNLQSKLKPRSAMFVSKIALKK